MGYSYQTTPSGQQALCCDNCPAAGREAGVRRRTCPWRVTYMDGSSLPYCSAPALCSACYRALGCRAGVHAHCKEGADASTARESAMRARIQAGDLPVRAAFGDWKTGVPAGWTLVVFGVGQGAGVPPREEWRLCPPDTYRSREYLSEHDARGATRTDLRA